MEEKAKAENIGRENKSGDRNTHSQTYSLTETYIHTDMHSHKETKRRGRERNVKTRR